MKKNKKIFLSVLFTIMTAFVFADNTVAVLEFETKDSELRTKMPILTDIFRSELANTASVNVVDRANTDKALAEIALQQSAIMSSANVLSANTNAVIIVKRTDKKIFLFFFIVFLQNLLFFYKDRIDKSHFFISETFVSLTTFTIC